MPLPLKPGENIYIDHKIKEASYTMPAELMIPFMLYILEEEIMLL